MIYEVYGPPSSGKSTRVIKELSKDKICLYVNADFQLMDNLIGTDTYIVNTNKMPIIKTVVEQLSNTVDVIVIDSLPMLTNEEENINKVITDMQKIISICNRNGVDLYIVNQYRNNQYSEEYTYYLNRLKIYYHKRIKVG